MAATEPQFLQLLSLLDTTELPSDGGRYESERATNRAGVGSNEGRWISVRGGSVTLLSQNWQLAASRPNSAESSRPYLNTVRINLSVNGTMKEAN